MNNTKVKAFDDYNFYDLEYMIKKFAEKHEVISVNIAVDNRNWFYAMVTYKDSEVM